MPEPPLPGCRGIQRASITRASFQPVLPARSNGRCAGNRKHRRKQGVKTAKARSHLAGEARGPVLCPRAVCASSSHRTQGEARGGRAPAAGDPCSAHQHAPSPRGDPSHGGPTPKPQRWLWDADLVNARVPFRTASSGQRSSC